MRAASTGIATGSVMSILGRGQVRDFTRQFVQLLETGGIAAPFPRRLQRRARGILARAGEGMGDQAARGDGNAVADLDMADEAGAATDQAVAANAGRAGH